MKGIRKVEAKQDTQGSYQHVRVTFGPHYFVELSEKDGNVEFVLGATHHGFKADASEVGGELETIINEIRKANPDNAVD